MISIKTNIRLYLPDVLQDTDNILNKLTTISTTVNAGRIYFWTDKDSLDDKKITDFVEKYQSNNIHSLKSIIRPTSDKPVIKKQKRNDGEDSNYRE